MKLQTLLLTCALALAGCASPSVVTLKPAPFRADPLPPELARKDTPTLTQELLKLLSESPTAVTPPLPSTPK